MSWKHFKATLAFRWKVKGKARDFNWHTVIGFWSSLVLIILTATAVVMSYNWANNLVYTITGNEPPQQQQRPPNNQEEKPFALPENLNEILTRAENFTDWKSISLRLPIAEDTANFTIEEGKYWNKFGRSSLTIDAKTAKISKWESYGDQNAGRQLRSWVRFTHTGETGGIVGQFIGFLACIGGAFLVWTGISLALRRFYRSNFKVQSQRLIEGKKRGADWSAIRPGCNASERRKRRSIICSVAVNGHFSALPRLLQPGRIALQSVELRTGFD